MNPYECVVCHSLHSDPVKAFKCNHLGQGRENYEKDSTIETLKLNVLKLQDLCLRLNLIMKELVDIVGKL